MNGAAGDTTYMQTRNRNPSTENTAKSKKKVFRIQIKTS
jgi:hypothetical protein